MGVRDFFEGMDNRAQFMAGVTAGQAGNVQRRRSFYFAEGQRLANNPLYKGRSASELYEYAKDDWADAEEARAAEYEVEYDAADADDADDADEDLADQDDADLDTADVDDADYDEADDDDEETEAA